MDGIAERLHLGQARESVLAAWGIFGDGKKVLLHLAPGTKEDTASCRDIRDELNRAHEERTTPAVNANLTASQTRLSSKTRT